MCFPHQGEWVPVSSQRLFFNHLCWGTIKVSHPDYGRVDEGFELEDLLDCGMVVMILPMPDVGGHYCEDFPFGKLDMGCCPV